MNARILMSDKEPATKGITPDWLVRGVLTKIGDIFDRLTGRGWKPSSSLATSELVEKLKILLDSEVRDEPPGCKFVPNNIKLKMQWDKFSTDSEKDFRKLETELLAAAVDHINDKRYFTHAPLLIEAKPDYFTPGVRLLVSFDKFTDEDREAAVHLSMPGGHDENIDDSVAPHRTERTFTAAYSRDGIQTSKTLELTKGVRLSVGRTKENDLAINDPSISKIHASLTVDDSGRLIVADTGSTNGTFVNGERIAYGKAVTVSDNGQVNFGTVRVVFKAVHIPFPGENLDLPVTSAPPATTIDDQVMRTEKLDTSNSDLPLQPAPTQPAIEVDPPAPTEPALNIKTIPDAKKGGEFK